MNEIIGNIGRVLGGIGLLTLLTNYPVLVKAETALSPPKIDDTFHYEKIYKARLEDSVVSQTSLNQIVENQTIDNSNRTKSSVVYFKDPNLEAAVRSSLGYGVSNVTVYDMANLYSLNGNNKNISDLSGLEYAYNLSTIHLSNNHIKDITPLRDLTNLVNIQINDNLINDISPLGGLNKLMTLNLNNNHITDFSKIPSSVTNLTITKQYPKLNVYLNDDNTWENPFINRDGTYMNFGLMPSRIQVSADKKTLKFLDATIGTTYNFNVVGNGVTIDAMLNIASPTIDLTANPKPNQNTIRLDWTSLTNNSYKVYQKKPGDTDFQTISVMDFKDTEQVKVLNIYPTYDVPDSTGYDIAGKLKKKSALLEEWIGVYGMGKIQVDSLNKEDFEANPDKWLKNSDGSYKYDVLAIGFWNILVTQQHLNDTGVQAISDFIDSGRGVLAGHHQIGEPAANNGNWKDYRVNVGLTKIREKFGVETFAEQNHYYDSKQPGVDFELGVANYENNSDSRYIYLGSKLRAVKNGLLLNYPHEIADFNKEFTVAQSHQPFLFFKGDTWFNFSEGLSYVRPFSNKTPAVEITTSGKTGEKGTNNSYLHTWNNTAIIQTGHVSVNGNLTATVDEQKILANTLFYLKQLTAQNYLDDYSGQDLAAPNKPSWKAVDSDYYGRVIVQLNPTVDKGSTYEYYVEATSKSGNKKVKSNIASATITTGIKGYSYVVDSNPNTIPDDVIEVTDGSRIVLDAASNGKYLHIKAIDNGRGSGNASETLHIKLDVKPKVFSLTAEANNKENMIRLDWTGVNESTYQVYQKKPGSNSFESISITDLDDSSQINVLNIYPYRPTDTAMTPISFKTWDGESLTLPKSAALKKWMEEPVEGYPKGYGMGKIEVTPVSQADFNKNPVSYLKNNDGTWKYDVIVNGFWDTNAGHDYTKESINLIRQFISDGKGYLIGHDTILSLTPYVNRLSNELREFINIKIPQDLGLTGDSFGGNDYQNATEVTILKKGLLTNYPHQIGEIGSTLTIPSTHNSGQMAYGNVWLDFTAHTGTSDPNGKGTSNHYLTTWNNMAMIQTGHSVGEATADEQKILANTIFYLNQLSSTNYLDDYSGQDLAIPNKPALTELKTDEYGRVKMNFAPMKDSGSTYEYYVEARSLEDDSVVQSNIARATVTTGIKGVSYVIDNNPNTIPDNVIEVKELQGMIFNESDIGKYLHVKVIDNSRSDGNESETLHIKIEPLELSAQANASENFIQLDWDEVDNSTYKVYQKKPGSEVFQNIELVTDNHLDDYSGQDIAAPTNLSIKSISYTMDNKINVVINPSKDNGSTYEYYVEAERKDGLFKTTSNKVTETITTGLAGYSYVVDNKSNTTPNDIVDTTSTTIQIPTNNQGKYYIHIKALDGAGNASETIHYELTDTTKPDLVVTANKTAWTNKDVILTAEAEDTGSGLKHLVLPDGKKTTEKTAVYTVSKNGTYRFQAEDYMGNVTTVDKSVRNIDKVAPTGGIVIADGQEKLSSEETWIEFSYADDLSGVALIEVYDLDVNGNPIGEAFRSEKPTQGNWQLEWILSHPYQKDGYQKARVGIRITDNAGNVSTYQSQEVIIESFKINRFTLTSVVNPSVYNATNPFVPLEFPNIPSQELLAGGSFSFRVNYQQSSTIPSSYRADCVANIYLIGPNGYNKKYTVTSENQLLTGQFEMTYEIPFDAPDETAVYIDIKASLKTDAGKLHSYDIFPKPDGTKLQIGVIKGDIRESIKFNEIR